MLDGACVPQLVHLRGHNGESLACLILCAAPVRLDCAVLWTVLVVRECLPNESMGPSMQASCAPLKKGWVPRNDSLLSSDALIVCVKARASHLTMKQMQSAPRARHNLADKTDVSTKQVLVRTEYTRMARSRVSLRQWHGSTHTLVDNVGVSLLARYTRCTRQAGYKKVRKVLILQGLGRSCKGRRTQRAVVTAKAVDE